MNCVLSPIADAGAESLNKWDAVPDLEKQRLRVSSATYRQNTIHEDGPREDYVRKD